MFKDWGRVVRVSAGRRALPARVVARGRDGRLLWNGFTEQLLGWSLVNQPQRNLTYDKSTSLNWPELPSALPCGSRLSTLALQPR